MCILKIHPQRLGRYVTMALALALSFSVSAQAPSTVQGLPNDLVLTRAPEGVAITITDVRAELQRASEAERNAVLSQPAAVQQIASNLIVRRMLAKEAERDAVDKDPMVQASLAIARDRVMSDARLGRLDAQNAPSDAALDAYARNMYKASGTRFEKPATTHARHILLDNSGPESLQKAKSILAQLRKGASFEELAKANSTDTGSAARGGDLGFFPAGKMVRPFEDAVNALAKPGDLSEPVESQFGYHIIRLEERREKGPQPYDEVKSVLLNEARIALLNEARVTKVESLHKSIVVEQAAIESVAKAVTP